MKKLIAIISSVMIICSTAACSNGSPSDAGQTTASAITADQKEAMDGVLKRNNFKGVAGLTKNGEVIYQYVNGKDKSDNDLTIDSSMYFGSVSKQFCATSIMMLREQGKLSVDDKLEKYFPEYEVGKDMTVKNLLTMRSGIIDMVNEATCDGVSFDNTEDENIAAVKEWIFAQPLKFEPDSKYAYSNSNYFLLADIVKQVSGKRYHDFVRENIFEPLKMTHSGFVEEVKDNPAWAEGLTRGEDNGNVIETGLSNGAGDTASNAADMDAWMSGISEGKLISKETFLEMTENYSPDAGTGYGYGLMKMLDGGTGHPGAIGTYNSIDYINVEHGLRLFVSSNKSSAQTYIDSLPGALLKNIIE